MRKSSIIEFFLSIYLGTSPVYWLPIIGDKFAYIKLAAIGIFSFLVLSFSISNSNFVVRKGLYGIGGVFFLIVFTSPSLIVSSFSNYVDFIFNPILGLFFVALIYNCLKHNYVSISEVLFKSSILLVPILCLPIFAWLKLIPDFINPFNDLGLSETGFTGARTGWSNSLALLLPVFYMNLKLMNKLPLANLLLVLVIFNQYVTGGRAGLIVSLLFASWLIYKKIGIILTSIFSAILLLLVEGKTVLALLENIRISEISNIGDFYLEDFDRLSSGRIGGYIEAIEYIKEKPIVGNGIGEVKVHSTYSQSDLMGGGNIHNLPLRVFAEGGLFALIAYLTFHFKIISDLINSNKNNDLVAGFVICITGGIFTSMLEPSAYWHVFQNTAIWWMGLGYLIYYRRHVN